MRQPFIQKQIQTNLLRFYLSMASFSPLTTFSLSALCKEMWNKGTKICKNHAITPWQERGKSLQRHLPWVSFQIGCPHGVEIHDLTRTTSDNALRTWCGGSIQTGLEDFHQARHYCSLGNCGPCLRATTEARYMVGKVCACVCVHVCVCVCVCVCVWKELQNIRAGRDEKDHLVHPPHFV